MRKKRSDNDSSKKIKSEKKNKSESLTTTGVSVCLAFMNHPVKENNGEWYKGCSKDDVFVYMQCILARESVEEDFSIFIWAKAKVKLD